MPEGISLLELFASPGTVLTNAAPGDLVLILDFDEPDDSKKLKVIEYKNLVSKQVAMPLHVLSGELPLTVVDGLTSFRIPEKLNGYELAGVAGAVHAPSTSGIPTIQLARGRQSGSGVAHSYVDMLTTKLSIDVNEYDSKDAVDPPAINAANKGVQTGDLIRVDVDIAGTGTKGLELDLLFQLP